MHAKEKAPGQCLNKFPIDIHGKNKFCNARINYLFIELDDGNVNTCHYMSVMHYYIKRQIQEIADGLQNRIQ